MTKHIPIIYTDTKPSFFGIYGLNSRYECEAVVADTTRQQEFTHMIAVEVESFSTPYLACAQGRDAGEMKLCLVESKDPDTWQYFTSRNEWVGTQPLVGVVQTFIEKRGLLSIVEFAQTELLAHTMGLLEAKYSLTKHDLGQWEPKSK